MNIYITLAQWTQIKSRRTGTDPYYIQSYAPKPGTEQRRKLVCITFMDEPSKSMFMLKYGEYL